MNINFVHKVNKKVTIFHIKKEMSFLTSLINNKEKDLDNVDIDVFLKGD